MFPTSLGLLAPGEMGPDWVGGVDVVDDVVRILERVVTPASLAPTHPLLLTSTGATPEDCQSEREFQQVDPVHGSVLSGR